jgi:hypothetical protein
MATSQRTGFITLGLLIGAWIFDPAISLRLNAFYLSEWATFLNDVRYGNLKMIPEFMRLSAALATAALAISARWSPSIIWRLAIRTLAIPVILLLLPPYPDFFQLWMSPSYGGRFLTMMVAAVGLAASFLTDKAAEKPIQLAVIGLCLLATGCAIFSYSALLQPFQAHFARTIWPGWAFVTFCVALLGAGVLQGFQGRTTT